MEGDALVGKLFAGRFHVEALLGSGGMGSVYRARHEVLQRLFALKVIRKDLLQDLTIAKRFRREAQAASRIDHPNIIGIIDFGQAEDGRLYLAMEYIEGPTLAEVLVVDGPFPVPRVLWVLAQIADALDAAQASNVIHRDLKPINILVTDSRVMPDQIKILDFGLAKIVDLQATAVTVHGKVFGTPEYISPERCMDQPADHRTDIYSLGIIIFELLVGRPPFFGKVIKTLGAHINEPAPAPSAASGRRDIPPGLDQLVLRCLAKRPEDRFQSGAEELHKDLAQLRSKLSSPTIKRRKTANLYAMPSHAHASSAVPASLVPPAAASSGGQIDTPPADDSRSAGDNPLTVSEWPEERQGQPGVEQPGLDRRPRALEELACAARDLGIGSPEISHVLSRKLQAEDLVIELEADVAVIEATIFELETTARERESRLRQALNQLEHEHEVLQVAPDDKDRLDTQPWDTAAFSEACEQKDKLEARAREIATKIKQIASQLEQELETLQAQAETKQQTMETLQREARRYEEQLAALLVQIKPAVLALDDPELTRLVELAGL